MNNEITNDRLKDKKLGTIADITNCNDGCRLI